MDLIPALVSYLIVGRVSAFRGFVKKIKPSKVQSYSNLASSHRIWSLVRGLEANAMIRKPSSE